MESYVRKSDECMNNSVQQSGENEFFCTVEGILKYMSSFAQNEWVTYNFTEHTNWLANAYFMWLFISIYSYILNDHFDFYNYTG